MTGIRYRRTLPNRLLARVRALAPGQARQGKSVNDFAPRCFVRDLPLGVFSNNGEGCRAARRDHQG